MPGLLVTPPTTRRAGGLGLLGTVTRVSMRGRSRLSHMIRGLSPFFDLTAALSRQDVSNKMNTHFFGKQSHREVVGRPASLPWRV